MPQIIVMADAPADSSEGAIMWRERITPADLESRHFTSQLLERLGWAVSDAHELEPTHTHARSRFSSN
jgi:hypothetical protein